MKSFSIAKVYYLLASIDVVLISLSLGINHNLIHNYESFVEQESVVTEKQEQLEQLSEALNNLNRPGNNVFKSNDILAETDNLNNSYKLFKKKLDTLNSSSDKVRSLKVKSNELFLSAKSVLENYKRNKVKAGQFMATMEAYYFECSNILSELRKEIVRLQFIDLNDKKNYSKQLHSYELLISTIVLIMVFGIILYGKKLSKEIKVSNMFKQEAGQLRDILDQSAIISITDLDGNILDVNDNFINISKYSKNELIGQNSRILNSGFHDIDFWEEFWQVFKSKKFWRGDIKNKAKDGSYYWVDTSIIPELNEDGSIKQFHSICYDITSKKQLEEELLDRNKLVLSIGEIQRRFLKGANENQVFEMLLDEILKITGSEYGYIGEVLYKDEDVPYLKTKSITDISWNEETSTFYKENAPIGLEFFNLESLFGYVLKHNEHVIANDPGSDKRACGIPPGHPDLKKYLGIALRDEGKLIGSVGIANKPGGYTEEDIKFLSPYLDTSTLLLKALKDKKEIIISKESAEAASKAKSNFLSSMSHEMRTPLNGILGIMQLIKDEQLSHQLKEDFKVIESSSLSLLDLVNDILDISKIEFGAVTTLNEPFNFSRLIEDIQNMFTVQAKMKGLIFEVIKAQSLPQTLTGDVTKIKQVLINLIGNAIKFTSTGHVKVRVDYKNEDAILAFHIEDTGIGVESEKFDSIFEVFSQEDGTTSKDYSGTGLGLSISKRLAELMHGDILLVSEKGKGSTFTFRCICPAVSVLEEKEINENFDFSKIDFNILLAEDNEMNHKVFSRMLEKIGLKTTIAKNGKEAFDLVQSAEYPLVFMDMMMPEMDGLEATRKVREEDLNYRPWIVACTANAIKSEVQKCYDAGMDDFLPKPIMLENLKNIIVTAYKKIKKE